MVRQSVRDRAAADHRNAVKYNTRDVPYGFELAGSNNVIGGEVVLLAVCEVTGDREPVDVGFEYEDAPTTCPLCGCDGTEDDVDTCTDAHDASGTSQDTADLDDRQDGQDDGPTQATLSGFGGGN